MFRDHEHSRPDVVFAVIIGPIVDIGDVMFSSSLRSEEALRLAWWALRVTRFTFTATMASIAGLEAIAELTSGSSCCFSRLSAMVGTMVLLLDLSND
jgi:hypothetical protein